MKKTLLLIFSMLTASFTASAQTLNFFEGMSISKMSKDGKILVATDNEHNLAVYNANTDSYTFVMAEYNENLDFFSPSVSLGFGRAFDNANRFVGSYDECTPAIFDNGEWTMLPIDDDAHKAGHFNSADDITPDGKRICGGIAPAAMGLGDYVMMVPVIWEQNPDGSYAMYKVLPHPELDFTGRVPQYITARAISEDGKVIVGQIVDYSGFYPMPIVYRENADGEWTYEIIGGDLIYNKDTEWPEWPTEPNAPNPVDYMTADEKAAYEQAVIEHDAAVDAFWNGEIEDYPADVEPADYITDPTQYNADYAAYQEAYDAYNIAVNNFFDVLYDPTVTTGANYEFNDVFLSADGKHFVSTLISEGESDPMSWFPTMNFSPIRFDLSDNSYTISSLTDAIPTGVLADGTALCASPANDYTRDASVWSTDGEVKSLLSHIEGISTAAADLVKENMTFTLATYDEETWEVVPGEEVTMMGTPIANADGSVFAGWQYNGFYDAGEWMVNGYVLDLSSVDPTNIASASNAKAGTYVVTNVDGKVMYRGSSMPEARKAMANGINIITSVTTDGNSNTIKVIKK